MAFAAAAHRAEGQVRRLKSTLKEAKVSKITIWQAKANSFQKGRTIFSTVKNIVKERTSR